MPPRQKTILPPLDLVAPAGGARRGLPQLAPRPPVDDDTIDNAARAVGASWRASQQLPIPAPAPERPVRLNLLVPPYLDTQLRDAAHEQRRSVTSLILEALSKSGFEVKPQDLVDDRRRKGANT